jgi:hypothetical protein
MTVQIVEPTIILKIDSKYPIIVAAFELLINICMKVANETCAIDHPTKSNQIIVHFVSKKNVISKINFPKINNRAHEHNEIITLKNKKLIQ